MNLFNSIRGVFDVQRRPWKVHVHALMMMMMDEDHRPRTYDKIDVSELV